MTRVALLVVSIWLVGSLAPASAQVAPIDPPSLDPATFPAGFVTGNFFGPEQRLQNTTPTSTIQLQPLTPREFFQAPELTDNAGVADPIERLFRHDFQFTVPTQVFGAASIQDRPLQIGTLLLEDILQLTFGLFENSVDPANLVAGLETAPPPDVAGANPGARISFADLVPGTQYIVRVAGVLNGFARIPEGHEGAGLFGWHGQYQGNIAVVPLPAAAVFLLTALAGLLGVAGWQRLKSV